MTLDDIAQVMEVEQQSFPTIWPPTAFKREIQQNRLGRYLVAVQRREGAPHGEESRNGASPEGDPHLSRLGRFVGGLRHILDGDETPPEERNELIVGFVGVWLLIEEAHIVTLAVRDDCRRRGVGELLLITIIETARLAGQEVVTLECRASNAVALRLYEKYGFQRVGIRSRYYSDDHEDAYILSVSDVGTVSYERRFERLRNEHRQRCGEYAREL
ncbi:MAG: ribosomal protein S18-alanine N-acetyltransferase [Chloroflexi bacterium]|nr:ribosomal protein S18-alanine N-acetyltransferase [Chloroflexota bacterium]